MAAVGGLVVPIGSAIMNCLGACFSCCAKRCSQSKNEKKKRKKRELSVFKAESTNTIDDVDGDDGVVIHNYTTVTCCGSNSRNANEDETYTARGDQTLNQQHLRQKTGEQTNSQSNNQSKKPRNPSPVSL